MRPSRLEDRLRAEAADARRAAPRELRGRVIEGIRAGATRNESGGAELVPVSRGRNSWLLGGTLAAAAAILLLLLVRPDRGGPDGEAPLASRTGPSVAALSHELLNTVSLLERPIDTELRDEARNLLLDTSRVVAGVVQGLPAPLRGPLLEKL